MRLLIYHDPAGEPWDITDYIPQDSLSLLQAELDGGALRASLSLELYSPDPDTDFLAGIRKPGILVIVSGASWLFALYYNPVRTQYDPTTRRYKLSFVSLLEALRAYLDKRSWWNVLDAATLMTSLRAFLSQYLPASLVSRTAWLPDSMSPLQEDPANADWPYFAGFIQPASWLVGKEVDYSPNGPYVIISVLGVAKSLSRQDTIYAVCLAKPNPWWSTSGDYTLPIVIRAVWNPLTWDWDVEDMIWHYDPQSEPNTWWWPVWFGIKRNLSGETGESALIYTTSSQGTERVVCVWAESSLRKPGIGENDTYENSCWLRFVLLDDDLSLLDQRRFHLRSIDIGETSWARLSPMTIILRGGGYEASSGPAGVVFMGINGLVPYNVAGQGPPDYGLHGQDGLCGVWAMRWEGDSWTDTAPQVVFVNLWRCDDLYAPLHRPMRLLSYEVFPTESPGTYDLQAILARAWPGTDGNLALSHILYYHYQYDAPGNTVDFIGGDHWRLTHANSLVRVAPVLAQLTGRASTEIGFILGWTLLEPGEGNLITEDIAWVDHIGGSLRYTAPWWPPHDPWDTPYGYECDPDSAGIMELDIPLTAGGDYRHDPRTTSDPMWDEAECEQNLAGQLRTLIACRLRPVGIRYETQRAIRRVKFLVLHQSFSEWEAFAVAGEYDPTSGEGTILTMDGRDMRGELVPKVAGGQFNESDTWRSVVAHGTLYANDSDPRSSGHDHMGSYGIFPQPVGVMSVPVVRRVCDNDRIYSEPGKLGYQNMMNPEYRYWWNVYSGHRGHIITPLAWWSFIQSELDYRERTNIALISESWDGAVHGLSYVAGRIIINNQSSNRICLVLVPRWPLRGDTHTISGSAYWEVDKPYSSLSDITERQFSLDLMGTYWDALILGPEGGAILTNIWWDEEGQMDRELLVSLRELYPQWFGVAYYRGKAYTDLLVWLRESIYPGARIGLRGLSLPVYSWVGMIPIGAIVPEDIMADLEARGDPDLVRFYEKTTGEPIPLFWQITGLRWDIGRNRAVFGVREVRGTV